MDWGIDNGAVIVIGCKGRTGPLVGDVVEVLGWEDDRRGRRVDFKGEWREVRLIARGVLLLERLRVVDWGVLRRRSSVILKLGVPNVVVVVKFCRGI